MLTIFSHGAMLASFCKYMKIWIVNLPRRYQLRRYIQANAVEVEERDTTRAVHLADENPLL